MRTCHCGVWAGGAHVQKIRFEHVSLYLRNILSSRWTDGPYLWSLQQLISQDTRNRNNKDRLPCLLKLNHECILQIKIHVALVSAFRSLWCLVSECWTHMSPELYLIRLIPGLNFPRSSVHILQARLFFLRKIFPEVIWLHPLSRSWRSFGEVIWVNLWLPDQQIVQIICGV